MAKKKAAPPDSGISIASGEPVLTYTGGPVYGDVPARDLSGADLAYVWRVAALRESGGLPVGTPSSADLIEMADRLSATGAFTASTEGPVDPAPAGPADEE